MPISGLVLTLSSESRLRDAALRALSDHRSIEPGNAERNRLPIVVDTPTSYDDKGVWEWLHELPGVLFVDLVCTDNSEDEITPELPSPEIPRSPGPAPSWNESHSHNDNAPAGRTGKRP